MAGYGGGAPISAFCSKPGVKELPLDELVMWDSFSYNVSVTTFYELGRCYYANTHLDVK